MDAGSKNGLVQNGTSVTDVIVTPGMRLRVGDSIVTVEESEEGDGELCLVLAPPRPAAARVQGRNEADTDGMSPEDAGPASEVLRLVRRIEADSRRPDRNIGEHLASVREVLGARSILLAECVSDTELAILSLSGALPLPGAMDVLGLIAREPGSPGTVRTVTEGRTPFLVAVGGARGARTVLVAALAEGSPPSPSWQKELLAYVAQKLIASSAMSVVPLASVVAPALVIPDGMVVGSSAAMQGLLGQVRSTVRSGMDVLLTGETGTGKELFARMIHASGLHPDGPFVAINCAAIPADLLEAELFGVQKGVATGVDARTGRFQQADGGTIFLDEVSEMAGHLQAKLLRVLQEREILPLGASVPRKISARVVSATNQELEERVRTRQFRADLFYRLRGLQFHLPPLRDRKDDIPELIVAFAERAEVETGKRVRGVSRSALDLLLSHDWPGNVREMENDVRRAVLTCDEGGVLTPEHFGPVRWAVCRAATLAADHLGHPAAGRRTRGESPAAAAGQADDPTPLPSAAGEISGAPDPHRFAEPSPPLHDAIRPLQEVRDEAEKRAIDHALRDSHGNKSLVARLLGISRNGLAARMKELGLG